MNVNSPNMPIIDSHVHLFPDNISRILRRWFKKHAWEFHCAGSADALLYRLFENGIAGALVMPYALSAGMAEELNGFVARLTRKFPAVCALAAIHPGDDNPGQLLRRAFDIEGFCGVKLHCHVHRTAPDDPVYDPIYETIVSCDRLLVIHAGRQPATDAYGMDVTRITGADRIERVLRRYPEMKVIVPHLGFDETDRFFEMLERFPNLYLDSAMAVGNFFPLKIDPSRIRQYADRIIYGSDYPQIPYAADHEVRALLSMNLGEQVNRKIFYKNICKLLPQFGPLVDGPPFTLLTEPL